MSPKIIKEEAPTRWKAHGGDPFSLRRSEEDPRQADPVASISLSCSNLPVELLENLWGLLKLVNRSQQFRGSSDCSNAGIDTLQASRHPESPAWLLHVQSLVLTKGVSDQFQYDGGHACPSGHWTVSCSHWFQSAGSWYLWALLSILPHSNWQLCKNKLYLYL